VQNIVLTGGGFMFVGVIDRLKEELIARLENPNSEYKCLKREVAANIRFQNYRYPPNIVNWYGGKIYSKIYEESSQGSSMEVYSNIETLMKRTFFIA
jgi:actin-related protein